MKELAPQRRQRLPRTSAISNLVLHLHPPTVPERALRFPQTLGLGGASLVVTGLLIVTGVLLLFVYEPSAEAAYDSVASLRWDVPFGQFIRNLHRWSGNAAVVLVFLHLLRVYFTGGHAGPRAKNWIVGLLLLLLVVFSNFTGYLLPWDQLAYWAVTIGTSMLDYVPAAGPLLQQLLRGGDEVGPRTLTVFFVLHIVLMPVALALLLPAHFWLVRKAGGVVVPPNKDDAAESRRLPVRPHLTTREATASLVVVAAMLVLALAMNAPLEEPANPGLSPNPAKAPWYFMGVQELLVHLHPFFAVVVVPLAAAIVLLRLPALDAATVGAGTWFRSAAGQWTTAMGAAAGAVATIAGVLADDLIVDAARWFPGVPAWIGAGLVPVAAYIVLAQGLRQWLVRSGRATREEAVQALVAAGVSALLVLTAIGALFRGEGMALTWPWRIP